MTTWILLLLAGICEVAWATGLKLTDGLAKFWPHGLWTIPVMLLSFVLLARPMRDMPMGTAYVVWTGIGAVGTALVGMACFNESRDATRLICIILIIAGIIGLEWTAAQAS